MDELTDREIEPRPLELQLLVRVVELEEQRAAREVIVPLVINHEIIGLGGVTLARFRGGDEYREE